MATSAGSIEGRHYRLAAWHLAFIVFYVVLYMSSNIFQTTDLRSTPWNPEAGLAVAAGAYLGWPAIITTAAANVLVRQIWGSPFPIEWDIISAIIYALIFAHSAHYFRRTLHRLREPAAMAVAAFILYALAMTVLSAIARMMTAALVFELSPVQLISYTLTLSVGNIVGILTITPLFFLFRHPFEIVTYINGWKPTQWVSVGAILVVSSIIFGLESNVAFKFFYLVFLPVLVMAVKDGFTGAVLAAVATDVAMLATLVWTGTEPSTATDLQLLMVSLSCTGLLLGAVVTERQAISQQLDDSRLQLQESQSALLHATRISLASEMAAALAHELNQPLSSIRNFIRSVRRKLDRPRLDRDGLKSEIDQAVEQVDSAAELIRETRRFLQRGEVHFAPLELGQLTRTCLELVQPELRKARISLKVELFPTRILVMGNALQLQQVLLNLIRNAREAITESKSRQRLITIAISDTSRPGYAEVSVSDTGPGLQPSFKPLLFKPLKSSKTEGLGLGLSLSSTIILAHGGEIWLDEHAGEGARFVFTIPLIDEAQVTT